MDLCAVGRRTRTVAAPPCSALFALTSDARNSVTDDVLVKLARQGDETAMAELLARYEGKLLRLAMRIVRNEHDAEEIVQDVSFTVWRKLPGFEGRAQIGTWLYRITVNASLMLLRTRGPQSADLFTRRQACGRWHRKRMCALRDGVPSLVHPRRSTAVCRAPL